MELEVTYTQSETKDGLYAYALHVEVVLPEDSNDSNDSNDGNDAWDWNIFVFRRSTPTMNPYGQTDGLVDDEFFNVATPVDMYDIPPDEPDICHGMPYYRTSEIDLWFRNGHDVRQAKADIDADIADLCSLCDTLSNPEGFKHEETKTHG